MPEITTIEFLDGHDLMTVLGAFNGVRYSVDVHPDRQKSPELVAAYEAFIAYLKVEVRCAFEAATEQTS
jgi:hypothetical protein